MRSGDVTMRITKQIRKWLEVNCNVKADATDDDCRKAVAKALAEGDLTVEKFTELSKPERADEANQFAAKLDQVADGLSKLVGVLTAKEKKPEEGKKKAETRPEAKEVKTETKEAGEIAKLFAMGQPPADGEIHVRVKEAAERYSTTKSAMTYPTHTKRGQPHPMAGSPVLDFDPAEGGRHLDNPSERDRAVVGAVGKLLCSTAQKHSRTLAWMGLPDHDKELVAYAMANMDWVGDSEGRDDRNDICKRRLTPREQKALIDDATSGGTEAVPIVFDDIIVTTPILQGELFPLVNKVPLDRGRRIQGAAAGIVGSAWAGVDDTAVTLFTTTSYITAFDTTIFRWQGSIRIGLDFLSDTPIDFGAFLTGQYGEVLARDLDTVIAVGNGTTQPEGVMTKAGVTTVAWGGLTTIGNYESLRFGVHKREHLPNMMKTAVFAGTDTSYQRAMAIPVGASDNRRLSSVMTLPNYDGYAWMGRPYKINESLVNTQIFYAILGRYRMYQRRGLTIRSSTEGDTLIRNNEMLLVAMARFGGQLERAAAACKTTTAPA